MTIEILNCLTDHEFYDRHKSILSKGFFREANASAIFATLQSFYSKTPKNISVDELKALHYALNPSITMAYKKTLDILFEEIKGCKVSLDVGDRLVIEGYKSNLYADIAQLAIDGGDKKEDTSIKIAELLEKVKSIDPSSLASEEDFITDDLEELFKEVEKEYRWKFPAPLTEAIGGIGDGVFSLIAARPNAGKTALAVALACMPDGFCDQGAIVHYLGVEEKSVRTKIRAYSSYTGLVKEELLSNAVSVTQRWGKIKDNFKLKDVVGMDLTELEQYVILHKDMNILIIDQLDKIKVKGTFAGDHDRLGYLYVNIREMAKKYNIAILGVCQASNDAEGKLYYGFECLANSKTSKAAELDLCICIGKESHEMNKGEDTGFRIANIVKNKLTGREEPIAYMLNKNLSRIGA